MKLTVCEMWVHVTWRQPELVEVCSVIQVKFYYMQTVYVYIYIYNIGCVCTVYRIQLYLKLLLPTQQGCKTLHYIMKDPRCCTGCLLQR